MRANPRWNHCAARRSSRVIAAVFALHVIALGGCAFTDGSSSIAQRVIHGTLEPGAPSVVMVVQQAAGSTRVRLCTGTVVGARVVVTAKHCVYRDVGTTLWASVPITELTVRTGPSFAAAERTIAVTEVRSTPGPYVDGSGRNGDDIAVLIVQEDLTVPAVPISRTPPTMGNVVELIGYGYTIPGAADPTDLGTKHRGLATVSVVEPNVFSTTGATWTCTGDSGGPVLDRATGRLIGVTSIGPAGCRVSTSYATRVDRYLALLDGALGGPPPTDAGGANDAGSTSDDGVPVADAAATVDAAGADGSTCTTGECDLRPNARGCACSTTGRVASSVHGLAALTLVLVALRALRRARL